MKSTFTPTGKGIFSRSTKWGALLLGCLFFNYSGVNAQTSSPTPYCGATNTYTTNNYNGSPCTNPLSKLARVQVSNIDHSDQCPSSRGVYTYWNNVAAGQLSPGADYSMTLTSGVTNNYVQEYGVYIDYNRDGDFSDPGEFVFRGQSTGAGSSLTSNFTVPCNTVAGQTRMRVRIDYDYNGSPYNFTQGHACGNSVYGNQGYGETWDFNVDLSSPTTPNANFTVPDTVYTASPAIFANFNPTGYISHSWDVINQGPSPNTTATNLTYTFPVAGTYQVKLSSTNCNGTDIETKSITVVDPTSAPQANFVVSQNEAVFDGSTPIFVDFYDLSAYGPTQWDWIITPDFLNGAPYIWSQGSNFSQSPQAFFYDVENYSICLAVGNTAGWDTVCKTDYIKILDPAAGSNFENTLGQQLGSSLDSGVIYDSGGPNDPYSDNEFYTFTIAPCDAEEVTLYFDMFNTENNYDFLKIYDGPNTSSPQIGNYTGTNAPSSVTATSGTMTLQWTSDISVTYPGFTARWGAVAANNGMAAADFNLPDTIFECSGGNDVVFENLSTGLLPGQADFEWIFDFDPNVQYPGGYSDATDESPTWSYSNPGNYQVRMVLKSCEGNDTMVKSMVIATTTNSPIADFRTSERIVKVNATATFTEQTTAACSFEWEVFPMTYELENGTKLTDREIVVKFTAPGSYSIKLIAKNDNGQTVEHKTNHVDVIAYCSPVAAIPNVADVGINRVVLKDIDNESPSVSSSGYQNFSADFSTALTLGQDYTATVSRNSNVNQVDRTIWIDYNRDGDFDDANELVASETGSAVKDFTGSFTVPGIASVIPGETRMRVGSALAGTNLPGCGPTQVGEYEDYTIFLELDDKAPVITIIGGDTSIEVNATYTDPGATAFDNVEGSIAVTTTNGIDVTQAGIYYVCYDAVDQSGNAAQTACRRVTVVEDLTNPTITMNGMSPMLWAVQVPWVDPFATASDMPSGKNLDAFIQATGMVDVETIGDYIITYTVEDDYGNAAMAERTVQVRDTTAPMLNANATYQIQVGQPFVRPFDPTDNFDMNIEPTIVKGSVNSMVVGEYEVEYAVTDASGNMGANVTVTYEVDDYIAPQIYHTPATQTVLVDVFDVNWNKKPGMQVTATDNFYSSVDLDIEYPTGFSINTLGTYVITYRATDGSGNESTFERTVVVVDREKPLITANPITIERWMTSYDFAMGVTVKDNYYSPSDFRAPFSNGCELKIIRNNVDFDYPGLYQITFVAIDGSGNRSDEVTRLVSVEEGAATGIENDLFSSSIGVYPNPTNGLIDIQFGQGVQNQKAKIQIVDQLGNEVYVEETQLLPQSNVHIDLRNVAAGIYLIKVSGEQGVTTKRIVIN